MQETVGTGAQPQDKQETEEKMTKADNEEVKSKGYPPEPPIPKGGNQG